MTLVDLSLAAFAIMNGARVIAYRIARAYDNPAGTRRFRGTAPNVTHG
jgi:hypothetical protein